MLIDKSVQVEKSVDDLMSQVLGIIQMLKTGASPIEVVMQEVMKLQGILEDIKALPGEFEENFAGALKAVTINAVDIVSILIGKA